MAEQILRERRDHRDLNEDDWKELIAAFDDLKGNQQVEHEYDFYGLLHLRYSGWGIHEEFFLPWHRDFLNNLELALRQDGKHDVTIPYWNWEAEPNVPTQLETLRREWGLSAPNVPRIPGLNVDTMRAMSDWEQFNRDMFFGPHGTVHIRIGGVMADMDSPLDPFFWLHHGNIDKIWADWQKSENGTDPTNMDDTMPPTPLEDSTPSKMVDIAALGYAYVEFSGTAMS